MSNEHKGKAKEAHWVNNYRKTKPLSRAAVGYARQPKIGNKINQNYQKKALMLPARNVVIKMSSESWKISHHKEEQKGKSEAEQLTASKRKDEEQSHFKTQI